MESLKELLQSRPDDLNVELKRAFRPLTPHINIDEKELDALTVLINLTDKTVDQKNLLDRAKCKEKLRDEKWWANCLNTVEYRQSHNLKFPDIRSDGIIREEVIGTLPEFLLSSSKLPPSHWAYSHDSKYVNKSAFFTSEFSWDGVVSCLGSLLRHVEHPLWNKLTKLGCYQKTRKAIAKQLNAIPPTTIEVPMVHNYLTQLSFPDNNNSYLSLSPVASQSIQSHFYCGLEKEYRHTALTRFSRATNMGVTAMTCGGNFRMLKSTPSLFSSPHHRTKSKNSWLSSKCVQSLKQYNNLDQLLIPENKQATYRKALIKEIQPLVQAWLSGQNRELAPKTLAQYLNHDLSLIGSTKQLAYEPRTTRLFIELLKREHVASNNDEGTPGNGDGAYLVIPNIRVCGASAMSTPVTIGIPSLSAFLGFSHAFERNLNYLHHSITVDSFAVCIHQLHVEKRGLTKELVEKVKGSISPPATHDDWRCDLVFSLILKLDNAQAIDQSTIVKSLPKRFARGSAKIAIDDFKHINSFSTMTKAIQSLPKEEGKWLSLHTDPINNIVDILSAISTDQSLTPTCAGYHFLEKLQHKDDSFRGYRHAFCEAIIGISKLVVFEIDTEIDTILWHTNQRENYYSIQPRSIKHGTTDKFSI
ncbi:type I-F CRISPR-associated protein Csy2 [Vibrio breoganii]